MDSKSQIDYFLSGQCTEKTPSQSVIQKEIKELEEFIAQLKREQEQQEPQQNLEP